MGQMRKYPKSFAAAQSTYFNYLIIIIVITEETYSTFIGVDVSISDTYLIACDLFAR